MKTLTELSMNMQEYQRFQTHNQITENET